MVRKKWYHRAFQNSLVGCWMISPEFGLFHFLVFLVVFAGALVALGRCWFVLLFNFRCSKFYGLASEPI